MDYLNTWQLIDIHQYQASNSENWIEEEENLIRWAETPIFEKIPLDSISLKIIYTDCNKSMVGIAKTIMDLEKKEAYSVLHHSSFFERLNAAKVPSKICDNTRGHEKKSEDSNITWLDKTYSIEDRALYHVAANNENNTQFEPVCLFSPLKFSNEIAKISSSLVYFHDLFEVIVVMREDSSPSGIVPKSILKKSSNTGTKKKVRISCSGPTHCNCPEELPTNLYSKVSKSRKTKKRHN